jgi:hypothetical protein
MRGIRSSTRAYYRSEEKVCEGFIADLGNYCYRHSA